MAYKILLVEDEALVHEMYSLALNRKGYEVDTAVDGEQALQKLMTPPADYDLVLLDVMMPKLDGISILRKIKTPESPSKDVPVFLLTNLGLDDVIKEAKSLGAVKCIIKSNTLPQQIMEDIEQFLAGEGKTDTTATPAANTTDTTTQPSSTTPNANPPKNDTDTNSSDTSQPASTPPATPTTDNTEPETTPSSIENKVDQPTPATSTSPQD